MPVDTHLFDERQESKESMNGISYFLLKLEVISTICERILFGASKGETDLTWPIKEKRGLYYSS